MVISYLASATPATANLELDEDYSKNLKMFYWNCEMVVCPWCGTNYAAFQSNCSKCGGPIQAVQAVPALPSEPELVMPPPPPREIADNYRWKLMLADSWSMGAATFALIGAIFFVVGLVVAVVSVTAFVGIPFLGIGFLFLGGSGAVFYWRYKEAVKGVDILRNGEAVIGKVTRAELNYSVQVNGRNPLTIGYQFQVAGKEYQNTLTALNHLDLQFEPGQRVCVLVLPNAPDYNSLYPHP